MNAISQSRIQPVPVRRSSAYGGWMTRAARFLRTDYELLLEACETVAGVFAMPLSHPPQDRALDRLDDHLLKDIGYERSKGPGIDCYF